MGDYNLIRLYPIYPDQTVVNVVIETAKGDHNKYDLDQTSGILHLDRPIHSALVFPTNYGYLPETISGDGDPLDAIVLSGYPLLSGSVVECRMVGAMKMKDEGGTDTKIICAVNKDPRMRSVQGLSDVPPELLEELRHFFIHIKDLEENKWAEIEGFEERQVAVELVSKSYRSKETS